MIRPLFDMVLALAVSAAGNYLPYPGCGAVADVWADKIIMGKGFFFLNLSHLATMPVMRLTVPLSCGATVAMFVRIRKNFTFSLAFTFIVMPIAMFIVGIKLPGVYPILGMPCAVICSGMVWWRKRNAVWMRIMKRSAADISLLPGPHDRHANVTG